MPYYEYQNSMKQFNHVIVYSYDQSILYILYDFMNIERDL